MDLESTKQQLQRSLNAAGRTAVLFLFLIALGLESPILVLVAVSDAIWVYSIGSPTAFRKQIRLNKLIAVATMHLVHEDRPKRVISNIYNKALLYIKI